MEADLEAAKEAAIRVLLHNARGPFEDLPRTAGWGYPEAYTRDMMISGLGMLASGDERLIAALRKTFEALARNQTSRGHIPGLAHDPDDLGASDTTPLFLMALAVFRKVTGEPNFLEDAARKALVWMEYQSPDDRVIVSQQPTSDWRDEQWVLGYGLFVNTVVHLYLNLFGQTGRAQLLQHSLNHTVITGIVPHSHVHQGLVVPHKPYYALWSYKVYSSERFDLLGNSLAILSGIATPARAKSIIRWIEEECQALRAKGDLAVDLPPNFFPYILPEDPDWLPRYQKMNPPGDYHNGGIWPFVCGFYVVAVLSAGFKELAQTKLANLAKLVRLSQDDSLEYGFHEWIRAPDGTPQGQAWQTWSAAMYLYAAACVEQDRVLWLAD